MEVATVGQQDTMEVAIVKQQDIMEVAIVEQQDAMEVAIEEKQDLMKAVIVNVATVHFLVRVVMILTTASEIYIVMPPGGLFDSINGDTRDIGQLWCCVFFGLGILILSAMAWRAPTFKVPLDVGPDEAEYEGSWLSRRRNMALNKAFIQDPSSPVPTRYWKAYGAVLFLDTPCLILWIVAVTLAFPWDKEGFLALLRGEPIADRYSDGAIEIWSQRWLPHKIFEIIKFLLFITIFVMTCTMFIWPYAWRWREARKPQVVLPPKGKRTILRPTRAAFAEMGKEI